MAHPRAWRVVNVTFGLVSLRVGIAPVADKGGVGGTYLCPTHVSPVSQRWFCDEGEHIIEREVNGETSHHPVTGYMWEDKYIVLTDDEKEQLKADVDKTVEIDRACPFAEIDPIYLDSDYLVFPFEGSEKPFDVMATRLKKDKLALIGSAVLTNRSKNIVFRWSEHLNVLVAHTCRFDEDIRWDNVKLLTDDFAARKTPAKAHLDAAKPVFAALKGGFNPELVRDKSRAELETVLAASRNGTPRSDAPKEKPDPTPDLMEALKASVEAIKTSQTTEIPY